MLPPQHDHQRSLLGRYPTTVATLSRRTRDVIEAAFEKSVEAGRSSLLIGSRLHDFGFRGCSGLEQSEPSGLVYWQLPGCCVDRLGLSCARQSKVEEGKAAAGVVSSTAPAS